MKNAHKRLFGTDGIRGLANHDPMTPEMSLKLGKALTYTLKQNKKNSYKPKIVIGKDTRLSGYIFEQALSSGIASMGADVLLVGPLPTPAIAFITTSMRADAGIVISASHNPYEDNGIKIFDSFGFKLPDEKEMEIEDLIYNGEEKLIRSSPDEIGKAFRIDDAPGRYVVFAKNSFPADLTLEGIKLVLDCANGAAYKVAPLIFQELGAQLLTIGVNPNGKNINTDCGSLNPELLREKVLESGADLGIALDGDADRVIFCDEKGNIIDGDKIIAICAQEMIEKGKLKGNAIITTLMSNMALERFIRDQGAEFIRTQVGDRYVVEEMRARNSNLGGEKSGHIIFLDHTTTGDGTLAALQVLGIMKAKEKSLSELATIIDLYPQVLLNVRVEEKKDLNKIPELSKQIKKNEDRLNGKGRINIRFSGTEPISRVMVEGEDESLINEIAQELAQTIEKELGVNR
ncbi:MAG: phosphoglucosamine mutase [Candidatus Dadabacteria bacterium]|nr:MAG: phosphoglucosamine mutase [Candidatus Dadabacteria bacterium]TDJ02150.1 MAG: phosphoglucosamine mutase [Candidatus Dadabacteria bacterium]